MLKRDPLCYIAMLRATYQGCSNNNVRTVFCRYKGHFAIYPYQEAPRLPKFICISISGVFDNRPSNSSEAGDIIFSFVYFSGSINGISVYAVGTYISTLKLLDLSCRNYGKGPPILWQAMRLERCQLLAEFVMHFVVYKKQTSWCKELLSFEPPCCALYFLFSI